MLRCGIDLNRLKTISTANDSIPAQHQLVCVARLEPRKGHEILLEAISILLHDGLPVSLKLIGDGTLRDRLVQLAQELDLSGSVEFVGWGSGADVVEAMKVARIAVLPSYAEGLPIVLMEALAVGRPVVATQIMGIPELVLNGRTGWLVPPRDAMRLASTLKEALLTPDEELNRMAVAGRSLVAKRHDTDKLMKELIDNISGLYPDGSPPE